MPTQLRSATRPNSTREHETLEAIFDNIPVMISVFDAAGRIARVNREWTRVLGWTLEEAQQIDILAETYPDARDREAVTAFIRRADSGWVEFRPRTRDGRYIDCAWARFALEDGSSIGFGLDFTDRKRVEAANQHLLEDQTRLRTQAEATLEQLRAIHRITDAALSNLGLDDLLREVLSRLRSTLQVEIAAVRLIDDAKNVLYLRAIDGVPFERLAGVDIPIEAIDLGAPSVTYDVKPPPPGATDWFAQIWEAIEMPIRSGGSIPLVVAGKPIGIVGVAGTRPSMTAQDLYILQVVADRVAPAIERGRLMEVARASQDRLKAVSGQLMTAQEEERRRVAVELHDDLGQLLTAAHINLQSAAAAAGADSSLAEALSCVDQALSRVRDLALDLRPSVLDDLGLASALRWYVDRFTHKTHIETQLAIDDIARLDTRLEITCFRLAQEALTNVARHAQARHAWVDLHLHTNRIDFSVRDDGIGYDVAAAKARAIGGASLGLLGMQERVTLMGGEFQVISTLGHGTEVTAVFPLDDETIGS
jgi:PAS domain S-box-containing protein